MNYIFIDAMKVAARVGIYPRELAVAQTVEISLKIGIESRTFERDTIADTIDYAKVVDHIHHLLLSRHFNLLETLAEEIANLLISDFNADWVSIAVAKLGIMRNIGRVGVVIERNKKTL